MRQRIGWLAALFLGLICLVIFGILISPPVQESDSLLGNTRRCTQGCLFLDTAWLGAISPCGDGLVAGNSRGEILLFSHLESGEKPQIYPLSRYEITAPVLFREGTYFVGDENGTFWAFTPKEGVKWSFRTGNQITGGAIGHDDTIWCGSHDHTLYAFASEDGKVLQTLECNGQINGSPLMDDSQKALFLGSCDGILRKIDLSSGKIVGELDFQSPIPQSPILDDGILFLLTHQGLLAAIDAAAFQLRYQIPLQGRHFLTSPCVLGDILLLTDESGKIEARSTRDGSFLAWLPSEEKMTAPQALLGDSVYAVSTQGKLFRWREQKGQWTQEQVADFSSDFTHGPIRIGKKLLLADENGGLFYYYEEESP